MFERSEVAETGIQKLDAEKIVKSDRVDQRAVRRALRILSLIWGIIPGTRSNRQRHINEVRKKAKILENRFCRLSSIDSSSKKMLIGKIRPLVVVYANKQVQDKYSESVLMNFFASILLYIFIQLFRIATLFVGELMKPPAELLLRILPLVGACLFVLIVYPRILIVISGKVTKLLSLYPEGKPFTYVWMFLAMFSLAFLFPEVYHSNIDYLIRYTYISGFAFGIVGIIEMLLFILFAFIIVSVDNFRNTIFRRNNPVADLVFWLVQIVESLERGERDWSKLPFKRRLCARIEYISAIVQHSLPRSLSSTGDLSTQLWLKGRAERIAVALREYKKWVTFPKQDTHEKLLEELATMLIHVINGNFDYLPQASQAQVVASRSIFNLIRNTTAILLRMSPAIIWLIFRQTSIIPAGPITDAITLLSFSLLFAIALDTLGLKPETLEGVRKFLP